jgi:hypothetical protein
MVVDEDLDGLWKEGTARKKRHRTKTCIGADSADTLIGRLKLEGFIAGLEHGSNVPVIGAKIKSGHPKEGSGLVVIDDEPLFRRVIKEAGKDEELTVHRFASINNFALSGEVGEVGSYRIQQLGFIPFTVEF